MKKKISAAKSNMPVVPQNGPLRHFVKRVFAGFVKRQSLSCKNEFQEVMEKLHDIEDSIEIIARELARQAKRGE